MWVLVDHKEDRLEQWALGPDRTDRIPICHFLAVLM